MIVVDAGHGGTDPGASGNGIVEKDYTLDISKYIANRLEQLGVPVTLTRSTDETLTPEERASRILNAYGNNPEVVVISNHLNSGGGDGAEAIYALRNKDTLSRIILEEIAKEGQNIRKWYQRRLPSDTAQDYYFIHRNTGVTEPVIVEYGFVDNVSDANLIKSRWEDLAEAVVRAITIYKGIPYDKGIDEGIYVVEKGDTLWSIAKKFNVGVDEIKSLNGLTSNTVSIGQHLKIPGYVPPAEANITYVVQKGDSLWSIATAYNTTVDELKKANNLTSNTLSVGQTLNIPTPSGGITPTPPIVTPTPIEPGENTYNVRSGDTLWSIANKYGVTVDELRNLNDLKTDALTLNQVLLIPVKEPSLPSSQTYTVRSGDNLYLIANRYGITVDELKKANNLTTNTLSIGQVLTIPTSGAAVPSETTTYTVAKGDSLYSIASRYGTTAQELIKLNNLSSSLLSIGQTLKIPATAPIGKTYVVRSGDSLWTIANKFNVTVNELRIANKLTTDLLSIGQTLQIP